MHLLVIAVLFVLANCTAAPPDGPPAFTHPPAVSTQGAVVIETTATVPLSLAELRAFLQRAPLIDFLEPADGLAPPAEGKVLEGDWPQAGAVRWLRLEDGHYVIERILRNEPERFEYQIWVFTNAAGRAVEQIVGVQTFTEVSAGETRFDWTYSIKPKNAFARWIVNSRRGAFDAYLGGATARMAAAARAEAEG